MRSWKSCARAMEIAVVTLALGMLTSCGEDSKKPTETGDDLTLLASGAVGPSGGSVEAPERGLRLDIPAGALSAETTITISERSGAPAGALGATIELGPDGTPFSAPVSLRLAVPAADLPAGSLSDDLHFMTKVGEDWRVIPSFVQRTETGLEAEALLVHFSSYALVVVSQTSALYGTWGLAADDVFAYGMGSILARFDGASVAASDLGFGGSTRLFDGWGTSASDHYVVGWDQIDGRLWHDDGSGWSPVSIPGGGGNRPLLAIDGGAGEVYAVGFDGRALVREAGSWTDVSYAMPGGQPSHVRHLRGVRAFGGGEAVAVGDEIVLVRSGGAWTETDMSGVFGARRFFLNGVWGETPNDVFAVGREFDAVTGTDLGVVLYFNGSAWARSAAPASVSSYEGVSGNASSIVVVGANGRALRSAGGASAIWETEDLCDETSATLADAWVGDGGFTAAVGSNAVFLYTGADCGGGGGGGGDLTLPFDVVPVTSCDETWTEQGVTMVFHFFETESKVSCFITAISGGSQPDPTGIYTFSSEFVATLPGTYTRAEIDVTPIHPHIPVRAFADRGASMVAQDATTPGAEGDDTLVLANAGGFTEIRVQFAHGILNEIRLTE